MFSVDDYGLTSKRVENQIPQWSALKSHSGQANNTIVVKREILKSWFHDTCISESRDKEYHEWQQSIGTAKYYLERLTAPGDVVLDPFLGCGTTAVAAKELNRHFIGCDVDQSAIIATRHRLTDTQLVKSKAALPIGRMPT